MFRRLKPPVLRQFKNLQALFTLFTHLLKSKRGKMGINEMLVEIAWIWFTEIGALMRYILGCFCNIPHVCELLGVCHTFLKKKGNMSYSHIHILLKVLSQNLVSNLLRQHFKGITDVLPIEMLSQNALLQAPWKKSLDEARYWL